MGEYHYISADGDSVVPGILAGNVKHHQQARSRGTDEEEVISIAVYTSIEVTDHAATPRDLKEVEKSIHIETQQDWRCYVVPLTATTLANQNNENN